MHEDVRGNGTVRLDLVTIMDKGSQVERQVQQSTRAVLSDVALNYLSAASHGFWRRSFRAEDWGTRFLRTGRQWRGSPLSHDLNRQRKELKVRAIGPKKIGYVVFMDDTLAQVQEKCALQLEMYQKCVENYPHSWDKSCMQQKRALTKCSEEK